MFILAYDIGTSGVKASLVNAKGVVVDSHSSPYRTSYPKPGWVEQQPLDWWLAVQRSTKILVQKNETTALQITSIGVTGHMLGCVPIDNQGRSLYPAMIHSDTRARQQSKWINQEIGDNLAFKTTGNRLDPRSPLCKILWLKENHPDIYRQTASFIQSKDYIVFCLTGNLGSTDYSDASHAGLMDIMRKEYAVSMLTQLTIDLGKLPTIRPGTDIVGHLTESSAKLLGLAKGIPVIIGGGDGACATLGAGVVKPGQIYGCLGTTAWIACLQDSPLIDQERRIFNILDAEGNACGVYGTVQAAGRSVQWSMDLFREQSIRNFDLKASSAPANSKGLIFLPYLEGERSPVWDSHAKGVYFGITPDHKEEHFMRATLEGVAYALRSVLDVYRENLDISSLPMIGGGIQSLLWKQILADVFDIELQTLSVAAEEATSLGVAIMAGKSVGLFSSLAAGTKNMSVKDRHLPRKQMVNAYTQYYQIYRRLYPALQSLYQEHQDVTCD